MFDRGAFAHADSSGLSVFRVVAVAGDVVACCADGRLSVDGRPITETYLSQDEYAHDAAVRASSVSCRFPRSPGSWSAPAVPSAGGCSAAPSCSSPASSG
jgi:hypothetical protein